MANTRRRHIVLVAGIAVSIVAPIVSYLAIYETRLYRMRTAVGFVLSAGGSLEDELANTKIVGLKQNSIPTLPVETPVDVLYHFTTKVDLSGCHVSDNDVRRLACFPFIDTLVLRDAAVSDDAINGIREISRLRNLDIRGTRISGSGCVELARLPTLEVLYIPDSVSDVDVNVIKRRHNLRVYQTSASGK